MADEITDMLNSIELNLDEEQLDQKDVELLMLTTMLSLKELAQMLVGELERVVGDGPVPDEVGEAVLQNAKLYTTTTNAWMKSRGGGKDALTYVKGIARNFPLKRGRVQ